MARAVHRGAGTCPYFTVFPLTAAKKRGLLPVLILRFAFAPPMAGIVRCFRKAVAPAEMGAFRVYDRVAIFANFYIHPIIRCFASGVKQVALPQSNAPFFLSSVLVWADLFKA
jgi:hypothetical protein